MPLSERWNSCPAMTGFPQSWQTPRIVTNDLRRIFSAVSVSSVRMAGAYVRHPRMVRSKKRVGAFGTKVRGCCFSRALPHTLPKGVHPFCASKKPSFSRNKPLQCSLRRNENSRTVFEMDQTVLLPHFSSTRSPRKRTFGGATENVR